MTAYGIACSLALLVMLCIAGLWGRRRQVDYGVWIRLCVAVIPLSLIGSRLLFSLTSLGMGDMTSPWQMFRFQDGGASIAGAFAGAVLGAYLVEKRSRMPLGTLMDGMALGAPLVILIIRLSEAPLEWMGKGRIVDTPWLSFLGSLTDECHPVFLYEALWAVLVGLVLLRYAKKVPRTGDILLTFMTLYGTAQMFFESLRDDGHMIIYYIRINQLTGLAMMLVAFTIWTVRWVRGGNVPAKRVAARCVVLVAAIVLGIYQEFQVDSNPNLLWEYALMAAGLAVMGAITLLTRRSAEQKE